MMQGNRLGGPRATIALFLMILSSACSDGEPTASKGERESKCDTPAPEVDGGMQATDSGGQVWVLPVGGDFPPIVGQEVKLVFRITGTGEFSVVAVDPSGTAHKPINGPDRHITSNFDRPGEEWGAVFQPDTAGCWQFQARRGDVSGSLAVSVS